MMRSWLPGMCVLLACGGGAPQVQKQRAEAGDLAILGATVVPMDRPGVLAGHTVLVRGDRIVAVAPADQVDTAGATVIDGRGKWLVPGLSDMHVHLWGEADLELFLLQGVTTVRNLFGSTVQLEMRAAIASGELDGPTLITAGPIVDGDPPSWPGSSVVTTAKAARAEVRAQEAAGYDWIKVYNGLSAEVYRAVLDEATAVGLPVAGHVPGAVGLEAVLGSGQRTIEHFEGYVPFVGEPEVGAEVVAATTAAGIWNCPTLVVTERFGRLDDPSSLADTRGLELVSAFVRDRWKPENDFRLQRFTPAMFAELRARQVVKAKLVHELAAAGANLVLGTDTGNPYVIPGFAVHDELALLVDAGLEPWQALHAATAAAAELHGSPGAFGVIAPGARADLVLVDGDPLADLGNLADPAIVIARGQVHRRADLLAAIAARRQAAAAPGDPFADVPALEPEGTTRVSARYEVVFQDNVIGYERAVLSTIAGGTAVIRGQAVYTQPMRLVFDYRATRDRLELRIDDAERVEVVRDGDQAVGTRGDAKPVRHTLPAGAPVAPQTIAEYFWYAETLADLAVGDSRTLESVVARTERGLTLEPVTLELTRAADTAGRRHYDLTGSIGPLPLTGTFTVDPDGAPHEVSLTVSFGTFATRRVDQGSKR
jgi:imidazolonepropionase-like amidohydrolase